MKPLAYFLMFFISAFAFAQTTYELEPGLKNNLFELNVANNTGSGTQTVTFFVSEKPEWISFNNDELILQNLTKAEKQTAQFYFNVSNDAPIGEESNVTFRIIGSKGSGLTKTYNLKVVAPEIFEEGNNFIFIFFQRTLRKVSVSSLTGLLFLLLSYSINISSLRDF